MRHIEIEFKNLLTQSEYEQLHASLPYKKQQYEQKNYYFDTKDLRLQGEKCALRLRLKAERNIITLKEPHPEGALETNEIIDEEARKAWLNHHPQDTAVIFEQLAKRSISPEQLYCFGALRTLRTKYQVDEGIIIALDHSSYHGQEDYELEVETKDYKRGKVFYHHLLDQYKIVEKETLPKIRRFFNGL